MTALQRAGVNTEGISKEHREQIENYLDKDKPSTGEGKQSE